MENLLGNCSCIALTTCIHALVRKNPFWPFSHYVLALCLKKQGDKFWEEHANKALKIFKKTTAVPNHIPDHSIAMKGVKEMLKQ